MKTIFLSSAAIHFAQYLLEFIILLIESYNHARRYGFKHDHNSDVNLWFKRTHIYKFILFNIIYLSL